MKYEEILDDILNLTKQLILFRTTEDRPEEISKCIEFIKNYFQGSKAIIREFIHKGNPSLYITFNKRKKQPLILNGHIDVVEGHDSQFIAQVKNNNLYGRGSIDMKAAVATMMVLMKNISRLENPPKIGLMIVSDEEIGGKNGTKQLVNKGYKADFVINGETNTGNFNLVTKHKGHLQVKIIAYGSSSHSARPWIGSNAIIKLMRQYNKLLQEIPTATSKKKWLVTINPTHISSAGPPYNVTPSRAELILDIRTNEEFTNQRIINIMKKLKIRYNKLLIGDMMHSEKKDLTRSFKDIIEKVHGKCIKYNKSCGTTDTKYFTHKGIEAVNFGVRGKNDHRTNEYVKIDSIIPYYKILEKFIYKNFI